MKKFNILAITGGGYRGLFAAEIIKHIEAQLPDGKLASDYFDLVCGTSVGGIIALCIGLGMPAEQISEIIEVSGKRIFKESALKNLMLMWKSKFGDSRREPLSEMYGNHKLCDSKCRLLIPAINYNNGKLKIFKTAYSSSQPNEDDWSMVDAALATSSAPVYFPIFHPPHDNKFYVDGGLIANSPGLIALHEARAYLNIPEDTEINLVSVKTMGSAIDNDDIKKTDYGYSYWGTRIINVMCYCQERLVNDLVKKDLGRENYFYFNHTPNADEMKHNELDNISDAAVEMYKRNAKQVVDAFFNPCEEKNKDLPANFTKKIFGHQAENFRKSEKFNP